jgi:hypothetical protein
MENEDPHVSLLLPDGYRSMTLVVTMPALSEPVQCLSQNRRGDALDECRKLMNARAEFCEPRVLLARGGHVHFTESGHVRCT